MVTRYVALSSHFDMETFSRAVSFEVDECGLEFVSQYMGVSSKTVMGWVYNSDKSYGEFPYPHMTNLLKFCNAFGYDPREFFVLED